MATSPAVEHALDVLTLLAREPQPVAAGSIARELNLPRSSVYRLLGVLVDRGFVTHLPEQQRYGLGVAVFELGFGYERQAPLKRIAAPVLKRLVAATTQNAHLAVLHGRDVFYLIEERAPGRPFLVTDVGVRLPATLTASGLAILARLSRTQVRALFPDRDAFVRRDGRGPGTLSELRRILVDVRTRGYAVEDGTIAAGLSSVAQAVCDHLDLPVAGIAVTFDGTAVDGAARAALVREVDLAAASLTRRLGSNRRP